MTLPIKEMGGLPEGEIRVLIEDCADKREATLDIKLTAHRDEITKRLERTEDVVTNNLDRLMDLQGSVSSLQTTFATVAEDNREQTKLLQKVVEQGRDWHEDDMKFRSGVKTFQDDAITRFDKLESDQRDLKEEVKRLRWIGITLHGVASGLRYVGEKLADTELTKLIIVALVLYVAHLLSPVLYHWLNSLIGGK